MNGHGRAGQNGHAQQSGQYRPAGGGGGERESHRWASSRYVSHSSLSVDERRRAETAFAEARDCVIVSTSTLELGIDVGDLDRVIQLDAPPSVASFLQRLGRTGRRPGATRNTLFLATRSESLLEAAALTRLWADGYVEPIVAPAEPWHLLAHQLLAVVLQERQVGRCLWHEWFSGLAAFDESPEAARVLAHLVDAGFLFDDDGMLSVGPDAERSFGRRNFLELTPCSPLIRSSR